MCSVTTQAVNMWIKRGKLTAAGLDDDGKTLVRVKDVALAERSTRDHPAARRRTS
jgi:hypothetical protein